jgi:ABC-type hemin transport system substrate-binding protein
MHRNLSIRIQKEDVVLVKREGGKSVVIAGQELKPEAIVEELGELLASQASFAEWIDPEDNDALTWKCGIRSNLSTR